MNEIGMYPELLQRLAGSLLHFVWQGALLALLAAIVLRLLAHRSAESRYAVGVATLGLMLAAPCVTFTFYSETGSVTLRILQFLHASAASVPPADSGSIASWTAWIVTAWAVGATVCWLRLLTGWFLSRRIIRLAKETVPATLAALMQRAQAALPSGRAVRLLIGRNVDIPMTFGWLRPLILLPATVVTGLDEDQLLAVLAHELAHIRRHDFLVNAVQRAVECVLFYHPAVWWISGRVRVERERCCDDLAARVCGDKLVYAQALIALEQARAAKPALAISATGSGVTDRVRRLLGPQNSTRDWQSAAAALLFVAILGAAATWQQPAFAVSAVPAASATAAEPKPPVAELAPIQAAPLRAIAAIVTAQGGQSPAQAEPQTPAPSTAAPQPAIPAQREAARRELVELRMDYSGEVFVRQAAEGDVIVVRAFLLAGMNPNATAFHDFGFGTTRKEDGAVVRTVRMEETTALIAAAANNQTEILRLLLAAGSDVTRKTTPGRATALRWAAGRGHLESVRLLLLEGNVDQASQSGGTALADAAGQGHEDVVRFLLDKGVPPDPVGANDYEPPIFRAACSNRVGALRALLDKGGNVNTVWGTPRKHSALACAAQATNLDAFRLLVERGADVNALLAGGYPALPTVLYRTGPDDELPAVVKLLLDHGSEVDAKDSSGRTPLHIAIEKLDRNTLFSSVSSVSAVIKTLIDGGANMNAALGGKTPLQMASRYPEIVQMLRAAGAKQ